MTGLAPSRVEIQSRLEQALAERIPVAVATVVRGGQVGAKLLILPDETLGGSGRRRRSTPRSRPTHRDLLARERSETRPYRVAGHDEPVEVFIETFPPPPTLLIFGAVHVAQPLSRFAKALGFDVIVSDARAKLATTRALPRRRPHHPGLAGRDIAAGRDPAQHLRRHPHPRSEVRRAGPGRHARARPPPTSARSAAAARTRTAAAVSPRPG